MLNIASDARRCHEGRQNSSRFHPGNRGEVFIWKNFQPTHRDPRWKNRNLGNRAIPMTHHKFYAGFRGKARSRKPDSCEETLSRICFRLPFGLGRLVSIWNLGEREFRFKVLRKTSLTYISLWTSLIAFQFS